MKKKQKQTLFDLLVVQPWWVSMIAAMLITLGVGALFPQDKKIFGVAAGIPFFIIGIIAAWRQWTVPSSAKLTAIHEKVANMNWPEFSDYLTRALQSKGYEVKPYEGKGADFEIIKPGNHMLLSCKRWKAANLGVEPLRELQAAAEKEALSAMCMTTAKISPAAFTYAANERIDLMDADGMVLLLANAK